MPHCALLYVYRKNGTSPENFRQYYENNHVPCIQRLSGHLFPVSHVRHYMGYKPTAVTPEPKATPSTASTSRDQWVEGAFDVLEGSASQNVPMMVMGQPADFEWDVCSVLTFTNDTHLRQFMEVMADEKNAKALAEDEEKFMDRSRFQALILGEVRKTENDTWVDNQES
ncbi:hypothetical protein F5882DRAFT_505319 [Hyaloscypha sp. PMI_1271]|nr:hypothetical protein F5882DRAFT_505319 [Hyaloscypha sp. PMI_1271]